MAAIMHNPWVWLIVMALIALFFIVRSALHIRQIERLRAKLHQSQDKIQNELTELMEGEDDK